jgi:hypothetical protein
VSVGLLETWSGGINKASKQSAGDTSGEKSLNNVNFSPGTTKLEGLFYDAIPGLFWLLKNKSIFEIRVDKGCYGLLYNLRFVSSQICSGIFENSSCFEENALTGLVELVRGNFLSNNMLKSIY